MWFCTESFIHQSLIYAKENKQFERISWRVRFFLQSFGLGPFEKENQCLMFSQIEG